MSLLRLITTAAVVRPYMLRPITNAEAWELYEATLADPKVTFLDEPPGLEQSLKPLVRLDSITSPKLWMDAYLAAFALAGSHTIVTIDKGFQQFKNLDLILL